MAATAFDFESLDAGANEVAPTAEPTPTPAPTAAAPVPNLQPPAADPAAAPAPAAAAAPAAKQSEEPTVPVATLTAERRKLREEVGARDQRIAQLEADLKALKNPSPAPPPTPEFAEDPKGYVDQTTQAQAAKIKRLEDQIAAEQEGRSQMLTQQRALGAIRAQEAEFAQKNPDYYDALEHSRNVRREQIKIFAPEADAAAIDGELTRQELASAFGLLAAGQSPAERAYAYAKTLGYTPKQAAAAAAVDAGKAPQQRAADGTFAPAAPAQAALTQEQEADLAARKQAAMTLGAGGGEGLLEAEADLANGGDVFDQARSERFKR